MQENESLSEDSSSRGDNSSTSSDQKDMEEKKDPQSDVTPNNKKEQSREIKEKIFRRNKTKKEKNKLSKFVGDGVIFKGKLIGVENIPDARGDKMCQESLQRLKATVKSIGEHKKKITISVSLQGVKIKDEKSSESIYHHPVHLISFISQDIGDARAFGYVVGTPEGGHQFIAIKTEKVAGHMVIALRDLFQTVLDLKQEPEDKAKEKIQELKDKKEHEKEQQKIEEITQNLLSEDELDCVDSLPPQNGDALVKENDCSLVNENKDQDEPIYTDIIISFDEKPREIDVSSVAISPPVPPKRHSSVDDLLSLQCDVGQLQEGIQQMDDSIALFQNISFSDPFIVPEFPPGFSIGINESSNSMLHQSSSTSSNSSEDQNNISSPSIVTIPLSPDKYSVFSTVTTMPSIFEFSNSERKNASLNNGALTINDSQVNPFEFSLSSSPPAPPKPPRNTSTDPLIFAELDPLGKDRPYIDKREFFQDIKNPPKKVLKELADGPGSNDDEAKNEEEPIYGKINKVKKSHEDVMQIT